MADAETAALRQHQSEDPERAALTNQPDVAAQRCGDFQRRRERGVHALMIVDEAEAVRSE